MVTLYVASDLALLVPDAGDDWQWCPNCGSAYSEKVVYAADLDPSAHDPRKCHAKGAPCEPCDCHLVVR